MQREAARNRDASLQEDARDLHRVVEDLLRAVQFRDRDRICCHGVTVSQCYALEAVVQLGPMSQNRLAGRLFLDKSTTSRVVSGLEEKGLIGRSPDPDDGRVRLLEATAEGRHTCAEIEADLVAETANLVADFDPVVRQKMVRLLGRLARAAERRVTCEGGVCSLG